MASVEKNGFGRYAHVDALRALAVMLVVVAHAGLGGIVPGGSGVTIFFVISGFVITIVVLREQSETRAFNILGFYRRRVYKIAPPLAIIVLVPSLVYLAFGDIRPGALVSQTFFGYNWYVLAEGREGVLPGTDVLWSLAIEEQFYVGFALLWLFLATRADARRWLLGLAMAVFVGCNATRLALAAAGASNSDRIYFGTDTRIDAIALGIIAALALTDPDLRWAAWMIHAFQRNGVLLLSVAVFLGTLVVREQLFRDSLRFALQGAAAMVWIVYGFGPNGLVGRAWVGLASARLVQVIGLSSYSVYLAHLPVSHVLGRLYASAGHAGGMILFIVLGTLSGIAIWKFVEIPVLRFSRGRATSALATKETSVGPDAAQ